MSRRINSYAINGLAALLWILTVSGSTAGEPAVSSPTPSYLSARLRNPFWPVGYRPDSWTADGADDFAASSDDTSWDGPASLLKVSGTSRMGARLVAIVNNELKSVGELVEVQYSGRVYQWRVQDIQPDGKVNLERYAVKTDAAAFQPKGGK